MRISSHLRRLAAAVLLGALGACGGGGGGGGDAGGGGGTAPLQYSGNTSAAALTSGNASALAAAALGGSEVSSSISSVSGSGAVQETQGLLEIGRRLSRAVRAAPAGSRADPRLTSVPVDYTDPCQQGGTVRTVGDISAGGTGTVTLIWSNCTVDGEALSGRATLRVDAYHFSFGGVATDYTLSFALLTLRGAANVDLTGTIRVVVDLNAHTETITENVVARHHPSGRMTKSEQLVFVDDYNHLFPPTSFTETISGRIYDSVHGYIDIFTISPLVFSTLAQPFPNGGELRIVAANNRRIRLTAGSASLLELGLDLDGNGTDDRVVRLNWTDLGGPAGANLADTDGDGMHDSWEIAFGLNPNLNDAAGDLDGDGFTNLAEYQAGTRPNVADAAPPPPPPPPGPVPPGPVNVQVVGLGNVADLVYDGGAFSGAPRIYATVRNNPGMGNPGSVVPIDPVTGALGAAIPVGIDPAKIARSHDGQYLYVGLDGQPHVQRINLATQAVDLTIPLSPDPTFPSFGPRHAEDIEVLPGSPQSIAVSLKFVLVSPRSGGVVIYDGAVPRPTAAPGHAGTGNALNVIEFSATAGTLYGYNNETTAFGFSTLTVGASGVVVSHVHNFLDPNGPLIDGDVDMTFGSGFIFSTSGRMVDPVARSVVRTFALPFPYGNSVAHDPALGRVFYLRNDGIRAFDVGTGTLLGTVPIGESTASRLIRWGANGLAFRTSTAIFILENPGLALIPPGGAGGIAGVVATGGGGGAPPLVGSGG